MLSIGYSACHWCHVMERESFEDDETARADQRVLRPIKVDREERPDVDDIYMEAVQGMTGQGGWPLTVFLDPEGVPFYGGTYFPPGATAGDAELHAGARGDGGCLQDPAGGAARGVGPDPRVARRRRPGRAVRRSRSTESLLARALSGLQGSFDRANGGFGGAPSSRPRARSSSCSTAAQTEPVALTLDKMMHGGIYDQLGGGFARYSVDAAWLVPHFEKMLYDNALLARVYLHGWQVIGRGALAAGRDGDARLGAARDARAGGRLLLGARRRLRGRGGPLLRLGRGGDARGAGRGGRRRGRDRAGARLLGREPGRQLRGRATSSMSHWAPARSRPDELDDGRTALYAWRDRRVRPGLDDKRICSWNALMIAALADAGAALGRQDYIDAASACARFVLESMRTPMAACCGPGRTARRGSTPISRTTPSWSRRCCASTKRRSRCAGSTPRARRPTR